MRTVIITIGLVVLGIAPFALADIDSNSIVNNGVEYYIQTDKSVYELGENVNILYRVRNLTNENVTLGTVSGDPLAYYNFWVNKDDNRIWNYPYISGELTIEQYILHPSEIKEFQTVWNMMNDNGTKGFPNDDFLVNPGRYNVFGEVALFPIDQRLPVSVLIDVIPEPATLLLMAGGMTSLLLCNKRRIKN
ncbi:MAG: PEP-CTERM sorting domain-containing protein [Sedimentisphaerales bacterium]|nr:PEP-CTERM sorting domain-containing protein [Sedimentisphaerales bacterium]